GKGVVLASPRSYGQKDTVLDHCGRRKIRYHHQVVAIGALPGSGKSFSRQDSVRPGRPGWALPSQIGWRDRLARTNEPARVGSIGLSFAGCALFGHRVDAPGSGGGNQTGTTGEPPLRGNRRRARTGALGGLSGPPVHSYQWRSPMLRQWGLLEGQNRAVKRWR